MNSAMLAHYAVLGVAPGAPDEEIRRAYRARARELHPDVHGDKPVDERAVNEEEMKAVTEAWSVLGDPDRRRRYDAELTYATAHTPEESGWRRGIDLPENDHTLLTALIDAYRTGGDGDWTLKRRETDRRPQLPDSLYRVNKVGGAVTVLRRVADWRDPSIRQSPIKATLQGERYEWDAFFGENDLSYTGLSNLSHLDIRHTPYTYLTHIQDVKTLARALAALDPDREISLAHLVEDPDVFNALEGLQRYAANYAEKADNFRFSPQKHEPMLPLKLGDPAFWPDRERDRSLITPTEHHMGPEGQRSAFDTGRIPTNVLTGSPERNQL